MARHRTSTWGRGILRLTTSEGGVIHLPLDPDLVAMMAALSYPRVRKPLSIRVIPRVA